MPQFRNDDKKAPKPAARAIGAVAVLRIAFGDERRTRRAAARRGIKVSDEFARDAAAKAKHLAYSATGVAKLDQLEAVRASLREAIARNETFEQWRRGALRGEVKLTLPLHHLHTIFRTNMQLMYSHGHGQWARQNTDTHPYLMYSAVNDSRTRPAHAEMHGTILPVGHRWWATHRPPNGWNCRCRSISLTKAEAERRGVTTRPTRAQPDEGFDWDPWTDTQRGVREAVARQVREFVGPLQRMAERLALYIGAGSPKG